MLWLLQKGIQDFGAGPMPTGADERSHNSEKHRAERQRRQQQQAVRQAITAMAKPTVQSVLLPRHESGVVQAG